MLAGSSSEKISQSRYAVSIMIIHIQCFSSCLWRNQHTIDSCLLGSSQEKRKEKEHASIAGNVDDTKYKKKTKPAEETTTTTTTRWNMAKIRDIKTGLAANVSRSRWTNCTRAIAHIYSGIGIHHTNTSMLWSNILMLVYSMMKTIFCIYLMPAKNLVPSAFLAFFFSAKSSFALLYRREENLFVAVCRARKICMP